MWKWVWVFFSLEYSQFLSVLCSQFLSLFSLFLKVSLLWMDVETQTGCVCPVDPVVLLPTSSPLTSLRSILLSIALMSSLSYSFLFLFWSLCFFHFFFSFWRVITMFYYVNLFFHHPFLLPFKPREPGSRSLKHHHWSQVVKRQNCSTSSLKKSPPILYLCA